MTLLTVTPDGKKIVAKIVEASNPETTAKDVTVFAVFDEINVIDRGIEGVISTTMLDVNATSVVVVSVSRNVAEVLVRQVAAGKTAKVNVIAIGV